MSKDSCAPACRASRARAGIRRERSMIRSGRVRATCAERPSVKSSKRRISFTMLTPEEAPSWWRKWSVTISVRRAGSSSGIDSTTRTRRPARARVAAVYRPAADPPTTTTSPLARPRRGWCSMASTIACCPNRTGFLEPNSSGVPESYENSSASCPSRRGLRDKWVRRRS